MASANWRMLTGTLAVGRLPVAVWEVGRSVFTDAPQGCLRCRPSSVRGAAGER